MRLSLIDATKIENKRLSDMWCKMSGEHCDCKYNMTELWFIVKI